MQDIPSQHPTPIKLLPAQVTLDTNPEVRSTTRAARIGFLMDGMIAEQGRTSLVMNSLIPLLLTLSVLFTNLGKEMLFPKKCTWKLLTLMADLTPPNG